MTSFTALCYRTSDELELRLPVCPPLPCHTDGATDARSMPSDRASVSAQSACSCAKSGVPCLATLVAKSDACARCASPRCGGTRPYCYSNRAARVRTSAVMDSRRVENSIICPVMPLIGSVALPD
jgi:hypothetical protein